MAEAAEGGKAAMTTKELARELYRAYTGCGIQPFQLDDWIRVAERARELLTPPMITHEAPPVRIELED